MLFSSTQYYYRVRSLCGEEMSDWSAIPEPFTTLPERRGQSPDMNYKINFSIYPNPNTGEFTIQLSGINAQETTLIQIKNIVGEDVYSVEVNSDEYIIR